MPEAAVMPEGSVVEHRAVETPFLNCEDDECDVEISGARVPLQRITLSFPAGAGPGRGALGRGGRRWGRWKGTKGAAGRHAASLAMWSATTKHQERLASNLDTHHLVGRQPKARAMAVHQALKEPSVVVQGEPHCAPCARSPSPLHARATSHAPRATALPPLSLRLLPALADHPLGGLTFVMRSSDSTMWYKDAGSNWVVALPSQ
jgi:hypothetical protein